MTRRRPLAIVLVTLASLLAYVAILAICVNRQALDTENWTRASSGMLESPTVRNQVAEYLVDQLYANVDVQAEIRDALPPRAQPLAGPAAAGLRNLAERAANEALSCIAYGAFAVVAAVVVLWWAPTPATRNPVTAIVLVVLAGLGFEALRRKSAREFPDADRHEFEQRARGPARRARGIVTSPYGQSIWICPRVLR